MKFIHCCLLLGLSLSAQVQAGETLQDYWHSAALQLSGEGSWYRLGLPFAATLPPGMAICAICANSTATARCSPMR